MFLEVYPQVLGVSTLKRCTKCGEFKPFDAFSKHALGRNGLRPNCKSCAHDSYVASIPLVREQQRQYRQVNKDRIRDRDRRYYALNTDRIKARKKQYYTSNSEAIIEKSRRHYALHRAERIERNREYYAENADIRRAWQKEYYKTDAGRDAIRTASHRRRARKAEVGGHCTQSDLAKIRASQTDKQNRLICWKCGKPIKGTPHLDHWIPLKHGGRNDAGNLHYMHAKCNLNKSSKHPAELGRLI